MIWRIVNALLIGAVAAIGLDLPFRNGNGPKFIAGFLMRELKAVCRLNGINMTGASCVSITGPRRLFIPRAERSE